MKPCMFLPLLNLWGSAADEKPVPQLMISLIRKVISVCLLAGFMATVTVSVPTKCHDGTYITSGVSGSEERLSQDRMEQTLERLYIAMQLFFQRDLCFWSHIYPVYVYTSYCVYFLGIPSPFPMPLYLLDDTKNERSRNSCQSRSIKCHPSCPVESMPLKSYGHFLERSI